MKMKSWVFAEIVLVVFLLSVPTLTFATECSGEIEFCKAVNATQSRDTPPVSCIDKFPDNAVPADIQSGYALLEISNANLGSVAIAVFTDPSGRELEYPFEYWGKNYPTWYEVVSLPVQELRETPGAWTFTYYVKSSNNPQKRELCSSTFVVGGGGGPTLDIDGIWKDTGQSITFYVQTYTTGSAVVIATKDLADFYVFMDSNVGDGIDVGDLANKGHHLTVSFSNSAHATADLRLSGSALQSYSIAKKNGIPTNPSNHGIWKTPACGDATMNYYIQTYDAGSAIVVGTADLSDFYVFMDSDFSDGIDADELSGKPYHLSMSFASGGSDDALDRCVNAPVRGSQGSTSASCNLLGTGSRPSTLTNSVGMTFKYIPPGTFTMGSPTNELGRYRDETQHQVTLTQGFYMQTTEITQGQWKTVMGTNPSYFTSCGINCPVEQVSWDDVQTFISKMNQRGDGTYRLPTEAEWEYAARAGSTTAFANGDITELECGYDPNLAAMGWYCYNSGDVDFNFATRPVAQKQHNAWGLYDMHGNVWEWCQDWYGDYPTGLAIDPTGPSSSYHSDLVVRGGGWSYEARNCRSAVRGRTWSSPDYGTGARLVRSYP